MAVPGNLSSITGSWKGVNHLWVMPGETSQVSDTSAVVGLVAQGKFITVQYTWEIDRKPQEGLLVIGGRQNEREVHGFWIDSWHNGDDRMILDGMITETGGISVLGSYRVQEGPDWRWRIAIEPQEDGEFLMKMYNITPQGQEERAVEAVYTRVV